MCITLMVKIFKKHLAGESSFFKENIYKEFSQFRPNLPNHRVMAEIFFLVITFESLDQIFSKSGI